MTMLGTARAALRLTDAVVEALGFMANRVDMWSSVVRLTSRYDSAGIMKPDRRIAGSPDRRIAGSPDRVTCVFFTGPLPPASLPA